MSCDSSGDTIFTKVEVMKVKVKVFFHRGCLHVLATAKLGRVYVTTGQGRQEDGVSASGTRASCDAFMMAMKMIVWPETGLFIE